MVGFYYVLAMVILYRIICSLSNNIGGTPYPGMHPNEVYQLLLNGKRMDPPIYCPEEM
jgi:hypothetical protein